MDTRTTYRHIIEHILKDHAHIPYAHGEIDRQTIFDRENDHYLVMLVGREGIRRVHGCLIHVDIVDDKIYIQRDGTEVGVANELMRAGVPKEHIVLAFRSPEMRRFTDFAVT
jgi:hypothetical protein